MDQQITISVKYTIDDPIRVARFIQNRSFFYRHDALLTATFVFLAFIVLIVLMANDLNTFNVIGAMVFSVVPAIIVGLVVYLMHGPIGAWRAKRRVTKYFEASPLMNDERLIEFSSTGISSTGELSSSLLKWEAITKVLGSSTDLIFYIANEKFGWYMKSAFTSGNDLKTLETYLKQRFDKKADLHA